MVQIWQKAILFGVVVLLVGATPEEVRDCNADEWRCDDGICVGVDAKCDGALHCVDGSDEALEHCRGVKRPLLGLLLLCMEPWQPVHATVCPEVCREWPEYCSYALSAVSREPGTCILPPFPRVGAYSITHITPRGRGPADFSLTYSCPAGYQLEGESPRCDGGTWFGGFPSCVSVCSAEQHACGDGACVNSDRVCDGAPDCADGSDERDCPAVYKLGVSPKTACPATAPGLAASRTGSKAGDKCLEYQEQLIYPCEMNTTLNEGKHRSNRCTHHNTLVVGSQAVQRNEFPHLVWLCKGQPTDTSRDWQCLGVIVSARFILVAADCVRNVNDPEEYYAIVGALRPDENITDSQAYRLKRAFKHPQYDSATRYNDIALVETVDQIRLGPAAVPACLDVFGGDHSAAVLISWVHSDRTLQKLPVTKATDAACRGRYTPGTYSRWLPRGVDATQVCYTQYARSCWWGAPLTVENHRVNCMHTVVALPVYPWSCNSAGQTLLHTAVASHVSWIEGIVWP